MRESFDNGKYTVIFEEGGRLHALRHGEPWRDLCGDGMVLAMLYEVAELRKERDDLRAQLEREKGEREGLTTTLRQYKEQSLRDEEVKQYWHKRAEQAESSLAALQRRYEERDNSARVELRENHAAHLVVIEDIKAQLAAALEDVERLKQVVLRVHSGDDWTVQYSDNPGVCVCEVCEPIRNGQIPQLAAQSSAKGEYRRGLLRAAEIAVNEKRAGRYNPDTYDACDRVAAAIRALPAQQESVCEWRGPYLSDSREAYSLGCRSGEMIIAAGQTECPMCSRPIRLGGGELDSDVATAVKAGINGTGNDGY